MALLKTSFISKTIAFSVSIIFSLSAVAALDFSQNQRLANQGNASAQYNLGVIYYKGEGVQKDNAKAVEWFKLAANQGHPRSKYNLEAMYSNGESTYPYKIASERISEPIPVFIRLPTTAESKLLIAEADIEIAQAEADIKRAQAEVGIETAQSQSVLAKSMKFENPMEALAKQGDAEAQYLLGLGYFGGFGSVKDYKKAFEWY